MSDSKRLRILVTNDDGVQAHGIKLLEQVARQLSDDVWVVAPEVNNSGAGHSLTLRYPLRWRRLAERHFAVDGTPTDCVLLALQKIIPDAPVDLVLSGVNHGGNLGEDVTYSGTVAAAIEATLLGVRAIALSQVFEDRQRIPWATTERFALEVVRRLAGLQWPPDVLMNVNFPNGAAHSVKGIVATHQGKHKLGDELVERLDPRGERYVWIGALHRDANIKEGTDLAAVSNGYVSVTPIHLDMTHYPTMDLLHATFQSPEAIPAKETAG